MGRWVLASLPTATNPARSGSKGDSRAAGMLLPLVLGVASLPQAGRLELVVLREPEDLAEHPVPEVLPEPQLPEESGLLEHRVDR